MEKRIQDRGQRRIAKIFVKPGHGAWLYAALKPVTHDQFGPLAPPGDEVRHLRKIVAVVGVAHDDELAFCLFNSLTQGVAVASGRDMDRARAELLRDFYRAIGRAVVGHYHLTLDSDFLKSFGNNIAGSSEGRGVR